MGYNIPPFDYINDGGFDWGRFGSYAAVGAGGGALVTGATFGLMQIPGVTQFLNTITGDIKSPLLRNLLNHQIAGTVLGAAMGAAGAYNADEDISDGAWKGAKMGLLTGTFSGLGSAANESVSNKSNIFTGKIKSYTQNSSQSLPISNQQIGRKFGEHMDSNTEGYRSVNEYRQLANDIYNNPGSTKVVFPEGSSKYAGETHYYLNGNLLRLDKTGNFRSLYKIK